LIGEGIALIAVHLVMKFSPEDSAGSGVLVAALPFTGILLRELSP